MNFKEELVGVVENRNSPKLKNIKTILKRAANDGERVSVINSDLYDNWTIDWLRSEGFSVRLVYDQRDGNYIVVTW